jgi:hypothetical protein
MLDVKPWIAGGFASEMVRLHPFDAKVQSAGKRPIEDSWQSQEVSSSDVESWSDQHINIGLRTRLYPCLDIDVDDPVLSAALETVAIDILGHTPVRTRSNSGRRALLYRLGGEEIKKIRIKFTYPDGGVNPDGKPPAVEILGAGQQTVVSGTHHTGAELQWSQQPVAADLATMSADGCNLLLDALRATLVDHGCTLIVPPLSGATPIVPPPPSGSWEREEPVIASALALLSPDCSYDDWIRIGQALHSVDSGHQGLDAWDRWSSTGQGYRGTKDLMTHWKSFHAEKGIGAGTLYAMAGLRGVQCIPPSERGRRAQPALVREGVPSPPDSRDADRPDIQITCELADMGNQLEAAFIARPVGLYQRCHQLVRVMRDGVLPGATQRDQGSLTIGQAPSPHLVDLSQQVARWVKWNATKKEWVEARPDAQAVGAYSSRSEWRIPNLSGIVTGPTMRPDGSILCTPGYDRSTGLIYDGRGVTFAAVSDRPTIDDARSALKRLQNVFRDFPFVSFVDRDATVAAILTAVARPAISGCVPAFSVSATAAGTGKTLLVDAVSMVAVGHRAAKVAQSESDEETKKLMLSLALAGDPIVLWDNLHHAFGGAAIDLAITAGTIQDRILGASEMRTVPWRAVCFATGQNMSYRGDIVRRVIPINLDAEMEHPEQRSGFATPRLLEWIDQNRPTFLVDALTLLRAYYVAGRPDPVPPLGSFEDWSGLVCGAIVWSGGENPIDGQKQIASMADDARGDLARLLSAWWARFGRSRHTTSEALAVVDSPDLHDALCVLDRRHEEGHGPPSVKRISKALSKYKKTVTDGMRLNGLENGKTKVIEWWVEQVSK